MQKVLFRNSAIYTVSTFVQKALMFLLLPFYTRYLSPSEYGIISVVLASSFFWTVFFTLGLDAAIVRFYYNEKYKPVFKAFSGTLIISIFLFSIISYTLLTTIGKGVLRLFYNDIPLYPYAYIGLLILVFQPVYNFTTSMLQAQNRALAFTALSFSYFIVNVGLTILFVVAFNWGAYGYILSILCAYLLSCMVGLFTIRRQIQFTFRLEYLKDALKYSYPFIPHSFIAQASGDTDKFILNRFMDTAIVGVYQLGYSISYAVDILAHSVGRAFSPLFIQKVTEEGEEGKRLVIESTTAIVFVFLVFGTACAFFVPDLIRLFFAEAYHASIPAIPILVFGFLNSGFYYIFSNPLFFDARLTKFIPLCTLTSGVITIGLDFVLVPWASIMGAASAVFIGRLVLVLVAVYIVSVKTNVINWPIRKTLFTYLLSLFVAAIAWYGTQTFSPLPWFAMKAILFLLYIGAASWVLWGNAMAFASLLRSAVHIFKTKA